MAHARVRYELFFKDVAQLKTSLQSLRARGRAVVVFSIVWMGLTVRSRGV